MSKILILFCPESKGGIALNAHHQAQAFAAQGTPVTLLCSESWPHRESDTGYKQLRVLKSPPSHGKLSRWRSRLQTAWSIMTNQAILDQTIGTLQCDSVLLSTYSEYLAPLWANRFRRHSNRGVWFGAMLLDPIRDYVVGPKWWHRISVRAGYSFLNDVFVHHAIDLAPYGGGDVRCTVVPHGQYPMPNPSAELNQIRSGLGIPSNCYVALCYGHLRDNKNLSHSIKALQDRPDWFLIVAGTEAAPGQKQSSEYQSDAAKLGVSDRVLWRIGYQTDQDTANLFSAASLLLLPYDKSFVSVSGLLFIAAQFRKPLLYSCGDGSLSDLVSRYRLGYRMSSSSPENIQNGLDKTLLNCPSADWERFIRENSYDRNVQIISDRISDFHSNPSSPHL
jgi:glycosyltransferase involved in cell wall biosynthesis